MKKLILTLGMVITLTSFALPALAQERIDLTVPKIRTIASKWRVWGFSANLDAGQFSVTFIDDATGETLTCQEPTPESARTVIRALNKADFRTNTFNSRALNRYSGPSSCLGVGTPAGTPE